MPARRRNVTWRLFAGFLVWAAGIVAATAQSAPSGGVRDVSPPGTTRFYREAGKESREKTVMLYDVMVLDTGALTDRATIVPLPIRLPERTRLCQTLQGGRWSCGAWARMALRNMVERAAVRCRANADGAATAPCFVQEQDIALWMIENGWAEPDIDDANAARAHAAARERKRGLFADTQPGPASLRPPRRD